MITQEIVQLITQIGVGNFLLILGSLFLVVNVPAIIERILKHRSQSDREKQYTSDTTFIRTQISNIWDQVKTSEAINQKLDDYINITHEANEQRLEEHVHLKNSVEDVVASIEGIEKMMRNVMSERDAMKLIGLKMGSTEDFKTKLVHKITQILKSDSKNGQVEIDVKAVINSEWLDLKSEFAGFSLPFNIRSFLDKFDKDLWSDGGMFTVIKNIAVNDLDIDRKRETISKQLDMGLRDLQAKLSKYLEEIQTRGT